MATLVVAHTSQLDAARLDAARELVLGAFPPGFFTDSDWEHALGGMHALVLDGEEVVGHAAVVQRRLVHAGRALRCGYVEAVAVRADVRRRGHGGTLMTAVGELLHGAYELGALGATDDGARLYERFDWQRWRGPLAALTPAGVVPTPDDEGALLVLTLGVPLDLDGALVCDWRDGDVW